MEKRGDSKTVWVVIRKNRYLTPDGKKIRSKSQLARLLGDSFDLSAFEISKMKY